MIEAEQEILNTLVPLIKKNKVLKKLEEKEILEIVEYLLENQFNQNQRKDKIYINEIISNLADSYIQYI